MDREIASIQDGWAYARSRRR